MSFGDIFCFTEYLCTPERRNVRNFYCVFEFFELTPRN